MVLKSYFRLGKHTPTILALQAAKLEGLEFKASRSKLVKLVKVKQIAGDVSSAEERLPKMCEIPSSITNTTTTPHTKLFQFSIMFNQK